MGLFYFYNMNLKTLYNIFLGNQSICTDTRKLKKNDIYFALKGENFDGNKFAKTALDNGASYCIIDDTSIKSLSDKFILVKNTLEALQKLANHHRKQLTYPIIGLTGSNGKTTTKELIYNVLSSNYKVKATKGNLNNHIGVPLTLLSFTEDLDFGIVEMGANHQKEIEFLSAIAEPDFGLITNFGKAHLEGFEGIVGVIKGKSELYDYLKAHKKTIFINKDDKTQVKQIGNYKKLSTFGSGRDNNCTLTFISANPFVCLSYEDVVIKSQLIGSYNYSNIAVAAAIGKYFNVSKNDIKQSIETYKPDNNRSEIKQLKSNEIIMDAYNANPTSMLAALNNFKQLEFKNKFLFLGDMFELGKSSSKEHQAIVDFTESHFDENIYLIGENFYATRTKKNTLKFSSFQDLNEVLENKSIKDAMILIKGSRGMALERILDIL